MTLAKSAGIPVMGREYADAAGAGAIIVTAMDAATATSRRRTPRDRSTPILPGVRATPGPILDSRGRHGSHEHPRSRRRGARLHPPGYANRAYRAKSAGARPA